MHTPLLLARHGQATSGPDHRWTAEDPLTTIGLQQAQDLGIAVAEAEAGAAFEETE